ncbi:hypothetical protein MTO96_040165 [Rhipicephalus appendiculatus]
MMSFSLFLEFHRPKFRKSEKSKNVPYGKKYKPTRQLQVPPLASCGHFAWIANQLYVLVLNASIVDIDIQRNKCLHCDKIYANLWRQQRHSRIYTNELPFTCPY